VLSSTTAQAQTGENVAAGEGSVVVTGNAAASAVSLNTLNTNIMGGSTVYFLINIFGEWSGDVHGLPEGLLWTRTPQGIAIVSEEGERVELANGEEDAGEISRLLVENTSEAQITNDVQVYALTGENYAQGEEGSAVVESGEAYASATVANVANTNIVGANWMLAIFNIFGSWSGNLSFGHPDLWIGGVAQAPSPVWPGNEVRYRFTVANNGDADATEVELSLDFDENLVSFEEPVDAIALGDIAKGAVKEFVYTARTANVPRGKIAQASLSATVTSEENDNNPSDNTEHLAVSIYSPRSFGESVPGGSPSAPARLSIEKTASAAEATSSAVVDYTIVVRNGTTGGAAYRGVLTDTLVGPEGEVFDRSWDLETIAPGDEITLTYSVEFGADSLPGEYVNTARLTGREGHSNDAYAFDLSPLSASSTLLLHAGEPLACGKLLTTYIRPGARNDTEEVMRLQTFLREREGEELKEHGEYDAATLEAVKRFQKTYGPEVLAPWGMEEASGFVYYTTQKKINELHCEGELFPLSQLQLDEIRGYASRALTPSAPVITRTRAPEPPQPPAEEPPRAELAAAAAHSGFNPLSFLAGVMFSWLGW
jgi:hypothetical protein